MESTLTPAAPAVPPAPYLGGKRRLASRIIERIALIQHTTYVEPFCGMGGVFLRRPFRAKAEVINDLSQDVANLFRVLQRHYVAFMDMLRWQLTSRAEFEQLIRAAPDSLTDLERAARFLYLQRTAFGGKIEGRHFGVSPTEPGRFDVGRLAIILEHVHARLAGVIIERLSYVDLLRRYDRPGTLFYLDPPYWGNEADYGPASFCRTDFSALATQLASLQGRFILSMNDLPEVRDVFAAFELEAVTTDYSINSKANRRARELIITGGGGPRSRLEVP